MMMNNMLLLFVYLFVNALSTVECVYFTMTDVQLNLPGNKDKYPPKNHALAKLNALPISRDAANEVNLRYALVNNENAKYLQIYPQNGDIMLSTTSQIPSTISAEISVTDAFGNVDRTLFRINFGQLEPLDCDLITQDLCYWHDVTYRLYENRPASLIGTLTSSYLYEICKGFQLNYTLAEGGKYFKLVPPSNTSDSWRLSTRGPLDRDVLRSDERKRSKFNGEYANVTVNCVLIDPQGTKRELSRRLPIRILDEDDNLPILQDPGPVHVNLSSNYAHKGDVLEHKKQILLIDRDSPEVNNYEIRIIDDPLNLLKHDCETFLENRNDEPQTVIHCRVNFTRDMHMENATYQITLQINDTTYVGGNESVVNVPIYIHMPHIGSPLALTVSPEEKSLLLYPEPEVYVLSTALKFARITQPSMKSIKHLKNFRFAKESINNGAFAITESEGIVYVNDNALLRKAPVLNKLHVQWSNKGKIETDEIVVNVEMDYESDCYNETKDMNEIMLCAQYDKMRECVKSCGTGIGGSTSYSVRVNGKSDKCMWRGEANPGEKSTIYSTCTPDTKTCPDKICDSLERLHYYICPQDCSDRMVFPTQFNKKTGVGIGDGFGVCSCDDTLQCKCDKPKSPNRNRNKSKTTTTTATILKPTANNTHTSTTLTLANNTIVSQPNRRTGVDSVVNCGTKCMLGIASGALFLLCAIAGVVICWRFDRVHKTSRGKYSDESHDLAAPLSDYTDRNLICDTIHVNFDMTTSLTTLNRKYNPDPKWEFPRHQLVIEQTLGEGEFGRVLRARAKDIAGHQGHTTVAVKTLKEDARETELADLLSEYELLKGVSHPNVIRLLGVSTLPGGPVYLIIEFAQFGSLRSYLRRSRHLKSESQLPSTGRLDGTVTCSNENYDEPICHITPKDILSFAWQICNGMSYLTDMKLVHRDLAARNVLLANEKICKISDFGLTRDIYEGDAYFKRSKGRVPVKWMAPESLSHHIYTTKSDVWSFGILVWELVTLGATPYPGVPVQNLFPLLKSGYRMERPENCSAALYKVMRNCWHADSEQRPTFSELAMKWEKMLSDGVEYLDLTPNVIHNRSYFCTNENDVGEDQEQQQQQEEEEEEPNALIKDPINVLNLLQNTQEYMKCGESEKIINTPENANRLDSIELNEEPQSVENYESPIKFRKNSNRPSPINDAPQYTNMNACKTNNNHVINTKI